MWKGDLQIFLQIGGYVRPSGIWCGVATPATRRTSVTRTDYDDGDVDIFKHGFAIVIATPPSLRPWSPASPLVHDSSHVECVAFSLCQLAYEHELYDSSRIVAATTCASDRFKLSFHSSFGLFFMRLTFWGNPLWRELPILFISFLHLILIRHVFDTEKKNNSMWHFFFDDFSNYSKLLQFSCKKERERE